MSSTVGSKTVKIPVFRRFSAHVGGSKTREIFGVVRNSDLSYDVPRISRNQSHVRGVPDTAARVDRDLTGVKVSSGASGAQSCRGHEGAKKARKPRAAVPHLDPLPIAQREAVTVMEAATVAPATVAALRHKIWLVSAYAKTNYVGMPHIAEFAKCICRPPGQRRVYLNLPRLLQFFSKTVSGNS